MPSEIRSYMSAPATPAAGPDSSVSMGRCRTSSTVITPPSQRMTMSGAAMPARFTDSSVMVAVRIIFGRMEALMTAVRVRIRRPYSLLISCVPAEGRPSSSAAFMMALSPSGLSTLNGSAATTTLAPAFFN